MFPTKITLVTVTKSADAYGDIVERETEHDVFAEVTSISQTEFYQAQAQGFKPEIKFVLPNFWEYSGEEYVDYTPFLSSVETRYSVIRTYQNGQNIELVCQRGVDK